ncbi:MAG: hypothetical protein HQL73_00625 [Magnetococcales bacterium]|nr:hypothetical protein [Magnetococcales bacterium]
MRLFRLILCATYATFLLSAAKANAEAPPVSIPRTILAFYDSKLNNGEAWFGRTHKFAEMPLNYLGLRLRYIDTRQPLPELSSLSDIRGAIIWSRTNQIEDPEAFLEWATRFVKSGKRLALIGAPPWSTNLRGIPPSGILTATFWQTFGFSYRDQWVSFTHDMEIIRQDPEVIGFEHQLPKPLPSYQEILPDSPDAQLHLLVRRGGTEKQEHVLVATTPRGGFIAADYAIYMDQDPFEDHQFVQWIINPFEFFRLAFATDDLPKADVSTLSNRRLYYSHIDGDGLRNLTEVKPYNDKRMTVAEVILEEIIKKYPDLPVTFAPVVGDIDPNWYGSDRHLSIARALLAPPHVEAGNHTLSHPLDWGFFENFDPVREIPYLKNYPEREDSLLANNILSFFGFKKHRPSHHFDAAMGKEGEEEDGQENRDSTLKKERYSDYKTPRSYASKPFNLHEEIEGSNATIKKLLPTNKEIKLLQWSGNTLPFKEALQMTRGAGMRNINGGNTRFDGKFPSVAWIAPLGRSVAGEWQCYASSSNENTYTNLWTEQFSGFQYLIHTIKNTETPRRLIPFNIYYHLYSGEKLASLNALKNNLNYARSQSLAPVEASYYSAIADGAIQANFVRLPSGAVEVHDRGQLQTIRFDRSTLKQIDLTRSRGVTGQRHFQGSLYVALDQEVAVPEIMIVPYLTPAKPPPSPLPYLLEGRWRIFGLKPLASQGFEFYAHGYGWGDMTWYVPQWGSYSVTVYDLQEKPLLQQRAVSTDDDGLIRLNLSVSAMDKVRIVVSWQNGVDGYDRR